MTIEYRPITESELDEFNAAEDTAYSFLFSTEDRVALNQVFDFARSLAAFEDSRVVGGACYYDFGLSVPGAELSAGGVTYVFAVPTHRRRGILTELMRRQLDAMHAEGIVLGALHAAESGIYGRFGYGAAAHTETLEIEKSHALLKHPVQPAGKLRLVSDEEAARVFPSVYDQYRLQAPGLFSRDEAWWKLRLHRPGHREGSPGWLKLVYERDGKAAGYAIYVVNSNWQNALPQSTLQVEEMAFVDRESYAALWHYLFGVDLVKTIRAYATVDPPLWWMLTDPRRLVRQTRDGLWLRLIDVQAALAGRKYLSDGALTIRVEDEFCPWNAGTYILESSGRESSSDRTDAEPDLTVGVSSLASAYLGGTNFQSLFLASLVDENTPAAVARADRMFRWHQSPMTSAPEPLT